MNVAKYGFVLCLVCACCFLMIACNSLTDPDKSDDIETVTVAAQPGGGSTEAEAPELDVDSESSKGYCLGGEILCLSAITPEIVEAANGRVLGGTYANGGTFKPNSKGGISFPLTINTSKTLRIEFEIKDNIPNSNKGETSGGKVSLATLQQSSGHYYFSLQRMYRSYRGGGVFRAMLVDREDGREDGAAFVITTSGLAGHYSMSNWGNETHRFEMTLQGNACQLNIDSYRSGSSSAPYSIRGTKNVTFILGNRELAKIGMGEAAQTTFIRVRITN